MKTTTMTLTEKRQTIFPLDWCRREGLERGDPLNVFRPGQGWLVDPPDESTRKTDRGWKVCELRPCRLLLPPDCGMCCSVKTVDFNEVKRQEAQSRMTVARKARRSPQAAAALQQRASLVGNRAKWRITNFKQVAQAIAKWA